MNNFRPDWDYLIEQIADAYVAVYDAVEANEFERARFWEDQLSLLTRHLDLWIRKQK
jgi:hypothetical protein